LAKREIPKGQDSRFESANEQLSNADYNVPQNGPENWLPIVAKAA
jgi:hypothetical protein